MKRNLFAGRRRGGGIDMYQRALMRAREILETHVPEPLPDDVRQRLRDIVDGADRELAGA